MMRGFAGALTVAMVLLPSRATLGACAGDCAGDGAVGVSELILGVNIALGNAMAGQCAAMDTSGDGSVGVTELVTAVGNALNGCPFTGRYTGHADVGDGESATIQFQVNSDGQATGTLSVATGSAFGQRSAIRLEIPLVNLTGSVDLDSGAYHLTGSVSGPEGPVPIDVSGVLPDRAAGVGTLALEIGSEAFTGMVASGNGLPTPTRTSPAGSPTPTATATPGSLPTEEPGCEGGLLSTTFSNVSGTNSYVELGGTLVVGPVRVTLIPQTFGGGSTPCHLMAGDLIRRFQWAIIDIGGGVHVGGSYELGPRKGSFDYLETPTSNPLGTRGWRSSSGSLVIDALEGSNVRFRVVDAVMVPEPSFSFQTPATGTFTLNAVGRGALQ